MLVFNLLENSTFQPIKTSLQTHVDGTCPAVYDQKISHCNFWQVFPEFKHQYKVRFRVFQVILTQPILSV